MNESSNPTLQTIKQLISEVADSRQPTFGAHMEQLIDFVSLEVRRWQSSQPAATGSLPCRGLARWQVNRVTAYAKENLDKDIDLQELAALVHLSRFYFCSAFRMATGYTPHEWLTKLRIEEAQRLLADPSTPITDIALAVGYQTPSAFAAAFRRHTGTTPRQFRRGLHTAG